MLLHTNVIQVYNYVQGEWEGGKSVAGEGGRSVNSWIIHVLCVGYFDVIDCYCIFGLSYCAWCFWDWLCNISFGFTVICVYWVWL